MIHFKKVVAANDKIGEWFLFIIHQTNIPTFSVLSMAINNSYGIINYSTTFSYPLLVVNASNKGKKSFADADMGMDQQFINDTYIQISMYSGSND